MASSSSSGFDFSSRSAAIYDSYLNTLQVLLVDYEVETGEFLTPTLNEIRATFAHLARASACADVNPALAEDNCIKAERHIKRAILDCYKGYCLAYFNEMRQFRSDYEGVDLHLADNGAFLPQLQNKQNKAEDAYRKARRADSDGVQFEESEVFALYEQAYLQHKELSDFLKQSSSKLDFARFATDKNRELVQNNLRLTSELGEAMENSAKWSRVSIALGILSVVLAVASIAEALVLAGVFG